MVQTVVLEDHKLYRLGVKYVFDNSPDIYMAGEADCGTELFGLLARTMVDIVLLCVNLPNTIGYVDITSRLRRDYPRLKILAVASENTAEIIQSMMKEGINGYIGKRQASRSELTNAVRKIASLCST